MNSLFRGDFVKEWVAINSDNVSYQFYNRILAKRCVLFYHECWKERCEKLHAKEHQRIMLK